MSCCKALINIDALNGNFWKLASLDWRMEKLQHPHPCGRIWAIARLGSVENWAYLIVQTQNENNKEAELPQDFLSIDHQECHWRSWTQMLASAWPWSYRVNACIFQFQTILPLHFDVFDLHVIAQAALLSAQDLYVGCQEFFPSGGCCYVCRNFNLDSIHAFACTPWFGE